MPAVPVFRTYDVLEATESVFGGRQRSNGCDEAGRLCVCAAIMKCFGACAFSGAKQSRGISLVGREGCKRPPHTKNMPVWARFTCAVAAGAGEAAGEAPNTKTRLYGRVFVLGFKGGVEEAWGGTRVWVPPRLQNT